MGSVILGVVVDLVRAAGRQCRPTTDRYSMPPSTAAIALVGGSTRVRASLPGTGRYPSMCSWQGRFWLVSRVPGRPAGCRGVQPGDRGGDVASAMARPVTTFLGRGPPAPRHRSSARPQGPVKPSRPQPLRQQHPARAGTRSRPVCRHRDLDMRASPGRRTRQEPRG
jgi:hypothetical protein